MKMHFSHVISYETLRIPLSILLIFNLIAIGFEKGGRIVRIFSLFRLHLFLFSFTESNVDNFAYSNEYFYLVFCHFVHGLVFDTTYRKFLKWRKKCWRMHNETPLSFGDVGEGNGSFQIGWDVQK